MFEPDGLPLARFFNLGGDLAVGFGVGGDDDDFVKAFAYVLFQVGAPVGFAGFDFNCNFFSNHLGGDVGVAVDWFFNCNRPSRQRKFISDLIFPVFVFGTATAAFRDFVPQGAQGISSLGSQFQQHCFAGSCWDVDKPNEAFGQAIGPDRVSFAPAQSEVFVALDGGQQGVIEDTDEEALLPMAGMEMRLGC